MECDQSTLTTAISTVATTTCSYVALRQVVKVISDISVLLPLVFVTVFISRTGPKGLSKETQLLTFATYFLRYFDLFVHPGRLYYLCLKILILTFSIINLALLFWNGWVLHRFVVHHFHRLIQIHNSHSWTKEHVKASMTVLLVSALTAFPLRYKDPYSGFLEALLEYFWAMSQYLGALACIPQIMKSWKTDAGWRISIYFSLLCLSDILQSANVYYRCV